jgi:hypothetical protein
LKYVLHLDFLDLIGNKSYNNLFFVRYWKILAHGHS